MAKHFKRKEVRKKEGRRKEKRRRGMEGGRVNIFPNVSLVLVTFDSECHVLTFPVPSSKDKFVFL